MAGVKQILSEAIVMRIRNLRIVFIMVMLPRLCRPLVTVVHPAWAVFGDRRTYLTYLAILNIGTALS